MRTTPRNSILVQLHIWAASGKRRSARLTRILYNGRSKRSVPWRTCTRTDIEAEVIQADPAPPEANQNVPVPNDNELEVIKILVTVLLPTKLLVLRISYPSACSLSSAVLSGSLACRSKYKAFSLYIGFHFLYWSWIVYFSLGLAL